MTPDNSHLVKYHMECAEEALKDSRMLFEQGSIRASVNRSYYAMFYAASSLLATKRLAFKKHSAVIAFFQKEFVKTGEVPTALSEWIEEAFEIRGNSDYEAFVTVEKARAEELLKNAEQFVAKIREIVEKELK